MPAITTIKLRRDTTSNWTSGTKTLAEGEIGIDTTTNKLKFGGSGGTAWGSSSDVVVVKSDTTDTILGGSTGAVVYQSASGTTAFLSATSSTNKTLVSTGTAPSWVFPTVSTTYFATTTSAQLLAVVTDATGSAGKLVFSGSPEITTPTFAAGGVSLTQSSGSFKTSVVAPVASGDLSLNLPTTAGTLALTTVTNSFLKADGTVQGSANAYMTGTLAVGASGFSVTTAGNLATAGTVTFTNAALQSSGNAIIKVNPSTGVLSAGKVILTDNTNVSGVLPRGNGGLGIDPGTDPLGTGIAGARSTLRIFVQSAQPASGNITGYTPAVGDLWFW
jgi:hypothetical protein